MSGVTDTKAVEAVYAAADAVIAAYKAVNAIPFGLRHELDTLLDGPVFPGDLDALAKKLTALADDWQDDIDNAEADFAEAEDRRRDNPLEPDYRRLGQ